MTAFKRVGSCRICGSAELSTFLSLGETPLANSFIRPEASSAPELRVPLAAARCQRCGLVQLTVVVDPEVMFRDYAYATSASAPMRVHFEELARDLRSRFAGPGSLVVEVGSNDGILLRPLKALGLAALGIEPASNLAAIANGEGLETINEFFDLSLARALRAERGAASVVVGNNVLAHIDALPDVALALDALLAEDGVFVAEVPYLFDLLDHVEYDTIYHEHLSYFHLAPLGVLFAQVGMELFDVRLLATHGGSMRIFIGRAGRREPSGTLREMIEKETARLRYAESLFTDFAARVAAQRAALRTLLSDLRVAGKRLAGYGATAKGNTMLNYCGITRDELAFIADTTPFKQGLLTPGTRIPVRDESAIETDRPDVMLLLAWNYADAILKRLTGYTSRGGRFIHPIPLPRMLPE